jgi:hypothetical protein
MTRISLALLLIALISLEAFAQDKTETLSTHGKANSNSSTVKIEVKSETPKFGTAAKNSTSTSNPVAKKARSQMRSTSGILPKED